MALAAYDAAKALNTGEIAHENGRAAWSGAYKAIDAQAGNDPSRAVNLFEQAKAMLDPPRANRC